MKVIFLDVDGVLNYNACWKRKENWNQGWRVWDQECINQLNRIIKETGAKIVVSSDWRLSQDSYDELEFNMGITGEFIGETQSLIYNPEIACRGDEIQLFLDDHKDELNIDRWIILDDVDDFGDTNLRRYFIQTSFDKLGLTKKCANRAIKMLNGEFKEIVW